jgi:hypothetical protein
MQILCSCHSIALDFTQVLHKYNPHIIRRSIIWYHPLHRITWHYCHCHLPSTLVRHIAITDCSKLKYRSMLRSWSALQLPSFAKFGGLFQADAGTDRQKDTALFRKRDFISKGKQAEYVAKSYIWHRARHKSTRGNRGTAPLIINLSTRRKWAYGI